MPKIPKYEQGGKQIYQQAKKCRNYKDFEKFIHSVRMLTSIKISCNSDLSTDALVIHVNGF